jgi:hypothetical protein
VTVCPLQCQELIDAVFEGTGWTHEPGAGLSREIALAFREVRRRVHAAVRRRRVVAMVSRTPEFALLHARRTPISVRRRCGY